MKEERKNEKGRNFSYFQEGEEIKEEEEEEEEEEELSKMDLFMESWKRDGRSVSPSQRINNLIELNP